jgi:hypothetical protein
MPIFEAIIQSCADDGRSPIPSFVAQIKTRFQIDVDAEHSDVMFPPLIAAADALADAQNEFAAFAGTQPNLSGRNMASAASQVANAAGQVAMQTDALARLLFSLRVRHIAGIELQTFAEEVATALYNVAVAAQSPAG